MFDVSIAHRALKLDNGLRVLLVRRPCSANLQHKRDHVTARTGGEESEEEEEDGEDSNSDSSDDQSLPGSEDTRQQKRRKAKMTASVCIFALINLHSLIPRSFQRCARGKSKTPEEKLLLGGC